KTGGVFVNPALTEPFGLTLIEAAACGLPVIAPDDGGPTDIIDACGNGLLINPLDTAGIGAAIESALGDRERWRRWSRSGIAGARKNYAWESHVDRYVKTLTKVIIRQAPTVKAWPRRKERLIAQDRMIVCDIDNTLIGDREGLAELLKRVRAHSGRVIFGVATGRSLDLAREALAAWKVPDPDVMIVNVGSEIYYGPHRLHDTGWERHIGYRWKPEVVHTVMEGIPGATLQGPEGQGSRKISYLLDPGRPPKVREITRALRQAGTSVNVIYSHGAFLDILPTRASKGSAVRYFADKWGIGFDRILVAGDSGNDEEMLTGLTLGVVVGNHAPELNKLKGRERVYFAEGANAWGVVEGLDHFRFFE
ncbi:MAG: HAD-IIB family hydrolase, partial [Nitrospinae bacterium]|nr:HAD-IIB family hydrolase [Nitrospinota bacterium]